MRNKILIYLIIILGSLFAFNIRVKAEEGAIAECQYSYKNSVGGTFYTVSVKVIANGESVDVNLDNKNLNNYSKYNVEYKINYSDFVDGNGNLQCPVFYNVLYDKYGTFTGGSKQNEEATLTVYSNFDEAVDGCEKTGQMRDNCKNSENILNVNAGVRTLVLDSKNISNPQSQITPPDTNQPYSKCQYSYTLGLNSTNIYSEAYQNGNFNLSFNGSVSSCKTTLVNADFSTETGEFACPTLYYIEKNNTIYLDSNYDRLYKIAKKYVCGENMSEQNCKSTIFSLQVKNSMINGSSGVVGNYFEIPTNISTCSLLREDEIIEPKPDYYQEYEDITLGDPMDCVSLTNTETYKIIREVFKWIQIAAPIMLIIFGVMDFGKAVASSDNDAMKKAQSSFIKRAIITAVIILLPIIMDFAFSLLEGIINSNISTCEINK